MGILDMFKGGNKEKSEKKAFPWIPLTSIEELDEIKEKSKEKTQAIFKHSTRCGISSMVIRQLESEYDLDTNADVYYLDLLKHRPISLAIAEKFKVMHQSPQLIVLKGGKVIYHDSHHSISAKEIVD